MITRKLNVLHINKVFEAINSNSLVSVSIYEGKKQKGTFMISYDTDTKSNGKVGNEQKYQSVELMRVLREIKQQVTDSTYNSISLEYVHETGTLKYSLDLKEQG